TWGQRPFSQEESAVDNYCISLLTFGEGYHNYHHTFANDYRNGTRWYHFDPTKWMIWTLNRLGLASGLKRVNQYHVKERLIADHKQELMELLQQSAVPQKEELCETVSKASEQVTAKISQVRDLSAKYASTKKSGSVTKAELKQSHLELKTLQKSCKHDWKQFERLYDNIMNQVKRVSPSVLAGRGH
ncbi:MAG: acyl-CoA desaturase, partial [Verrucomicrobia bacterium]|nr:acyl-CoA desaturase [Verrucomicrobiota bacterium]